MWADDYSIVWTISGVDAGSTGGNPVNTTLKISNVTGGSGTWTAVAESSYAGTNGGAQLGSGSYTFDGTVSLSNSSIPASATIKSIVINAQAGANYTISATVNNVAFGSVSNVKDNGNYTISGSKSGNSIVLSFACASKKNVILKKITVNYEYTPRPYTVTLGDDGTDLTEASVGAGVTLPSRVAPSGWTFAGWGINNLTAVTSVEQTVHPAGVYAPDDDVTLYPLFTQVLPGKIKVYKQLSSLNEVTEGIYVFAGQKNTSGAALAYLPNSPATGANPECKEGLTTQTESGNTYLSNAISADMLWDFTSTGTANQYYLRPHERTDIGLGCTITTGTNIRVSATYKDTKWTISTSSSYNWEFKSNASTPMYLVVYDFLKWRNYESASKNANGKFYLYKQVEVDGDVTYYMSNPTPQAVSITSAEYATYCNANCPLDFSGTEITVYTATDNETSVTLNKITSGKVPANTPVVLYKAGADGTTINVPVIASADPVGDNDLVVKNDGDDVGNMYVLANGSKGVGFYPWKGSKLNAGKVYLQGKASYARDFLGFNEGGTTAIDNVVVKTIDDNAPMYNLAGQRVNKSYKGVVIVNGKKMLNK